MSKAKTIEDAYAAWAAAKGTNPGVWNALMGPDFEFRTSLGSIPGSGFKDCYRRGEIDDYFATLERTFEMKGMAPTSFIEDGDTVVGLIDADWMNRATGKSFRCEVAAIWTFAGDKASGYRELLDTAGVARTLT